MPILYNIQMTSKQLREFCPLDDECMNMLKISVNELGLSARAHDKVLRLSRTIADLDGSPDIQAHHLGDLSSTLLAEQFARIVLPFQTQIRHLRSVRCLLPVSYTHLTLPTKA